MVGSGCAMNNVKLYFKRFSFDKFLHIIMVLMVFLYVTGGESTETLTVDCSKLRTCTRCAAQPCDWSVEKQTCANRSVNGRKTVGLTVRDESHCPRFSPVRKSGFAGNDVQNSVSILNDTIGTRFISIINKTKIACCLDECVDKASVINSTINCKGARRPGANIFDKTRAIQLFFYVTFDGVTLRFDNNVDYYFPIYHRDCDNTADEDCAICLWTDNEYMHYLKSCSSRNRCTGLYKYYNKRYADDYGKGIAAADQEVRVACPDVISVRTVEPLSASIVYDTVMTIAVTKHRILAENRTVIVTVAGRNCTDPKTEGDETIICTVLGNLFSHVFEGQVEVMYGTSPTLIVTSQQIVTFFYPAMWICIFLLILILLSFICCRFFLCCCRSKHRNISNVSVKFVRVMDHK